MIGNAQMCLKLYIFNVTDYPKIQPQLMICENRSLSLVCHNKVMFVHSLMNKQGLIPRWCRLFKIQTISSPGLTPIWLCFVMLCYAFNHFNLFGCVLYVQGSEVWKFKVSLLSLQPSVCTWKIQLFHYLPPSGTVRLHRI